MTPYEIIQNKPFLRKRSFLEKLFDGAGLNRFFLREGNPPAFKTEAGIFHSPCESKLVEIQTLSAPEKIKGKATSLHTEWYAYEEIVHGTENQELFENGLAFNFYLSPLNLHYCLFPYDVTITAMHHHPHFCLPIVFLKKAEVRNERLVIHAKTTHGFPIIIILIGSFMVSGIECVAEAGDQFSSGDVLGGFKLGSTVMVLFPQNTVESVVPAGSKLSLGEPFAQRISS